MANREFRKIYTDKEMRDKMSLGVHKLAEVVGSTIGPLGNDVIINNPGQMPSVTNDGITVANAFNLEDEVENLGVDIVRSISAKTNEMAGDGTTTSVLLADAMLEATNDYIQSEDRINRIDFKRGMKKAVDMIEEALKHMSKPVDNYQDIYNVARISSNNDDEVGKMIADAYEEVGLKGVLAVERVYSSETHVEIQKGFRMDRGYTKAMFVNNKGKNVCEYDNGVHVLMSTDRIELTEDIYMTLAPLITKDKLESLLVVCSDVDDKMYELIGSNKLRACICSWKGAGAAAMDNMEDLIAFTGAKQFSKGCYLGQAKGFISDSTKTIIKDGVGSDEQVQARIDLLKGQLDPAKPKFHDVLLNDRIGYLNAKIAVMHLGADTMFERGELYDRVEDATRAVKSAIDGGIVPGASYTFLKLQKDLLSNRPEDMNRSEGYGFDAVRFALGRPFDVICENAGGYIKNEAEDHYYDVKNNVHKHIDECDIFEPTNVIKYSIINAVSVCSMVALSNYLIM